MMKECDEECDVGENLDVEANENGAEADEPSENILELMALRSELQESREQIRDLEDKLLRTRADCENFRKRMVKDFEEHTQMANESLLGELLPILDNFNLGLRAVKGPENQNIIQGFEFILLQFSRLLESHGVEAIANAGDVFDPHESDALSVAENDSVAEDHIIEVVRQGYRIGKKLLRPATVIVSKGAPARVNGSSDSQNENRE
ncbi:MAG: nucleotide exchange factor GrpE [Puniceicoccales bacterium]|jgi:molecular chaperone GrpE|nr:nucleotide exchange factor GrpE [Puniceicoccales bacterium]